VLDCANGDAKKDQEQIDQIEEKWARKPLQPARKKLAKRKAAPDKNVDRKKAPAKIGSAKAVKGTRRNKRQQPDSRGLREVSGLDSGDLEGLSNVANTDSESVDELLEEGSAFEAGVVYGVEDSRGRAGKEVHTREVPEDDVPQEYQDDD
jgi:hypothetical protein